MQDPLSYFLPRPLLTLFLTTSLGYTGPGELQALLPDARTYPFLENLGSSVGQKTPHTPSSPAPSFSPISLWLHWLLPEGRALQSGIYHLPWLSAQLAGHPQQTRARAGIGLGLVPTFLSRVREIEVALFVEVTEGGAGGPLHWAEQVSVLIRSIHS